MITTKEFDFLKAQAQFDQMCEFVRLQLALRYYAANASCECSLYRYCCSLAMR
jgi:hypothetical protein